MDVVFLRSLGLHTYKNILILNKGQGFRGATDIIRNCIIAYSAE